MKQKLAIAAAIVTAGALLAGCDFADKVTEPWRDAPRSGEDNSPALVVEMPDGFNNVATKCIPRTGVRVAVIYHGDANRGSIALVADPTCAR